MKSAAATLLLFSACAWLTGPPARPMNAWLGGGADFNADGFADFVVYGVQSGREELYVYYGSRAGLPPQPTQTIETPDGVRRILTVGDINDDDIDDLLVQSELGHRVAVYHGGRKGLPSSATTEFIIPHYYNNQNIWPVGDLDGDDTGDFVSGYALFLTGRPTERFWDLKRLSVAAGASSCVMVHDAGDVDGNGLGDLVCEGYNGNDTVLGWSYDKQAVVVKSSSAIDSYKRVTANDFNCDGRPDTLRVDSHDIESVGSEFIINRYGGDSDVLIQLAGTPSKSNRLVRRSRTLKPLDVGDTNGDGCDDLVLWSDYSVPYSGLEDNRLFLYLGGREGLSSSRVIQINPPSTHDPQLVENDLSGRTQSFGGDGEFLRLLIVAKQGPGLGWWRNGK